MPVATVTLPDTPALQTRLAEPADLLVACYCAAWCDTCTLYRTRFEALAAKHPEHAFVWIDIEEHADLLGDEDIENFPTLLLERQGRVLFFGTMLPHIEQLDRLIMTMAANDAGQAIATKLPDVRKVLAY